MVYAEEPNDWDEPEPWDEEEPEPGPDQQWPDLEDAFDDDEVEPAPGDFCYDDEEDES
jgi:hypothetical protein